MDNMSCWQGRWEVLQELLCLGTAAIQRDLGKVEEWTSKSSGEFNKGKRKALLFQVKKPLQQWRLETDWLGSSSAEKDLEVLVDTSSLWASSTSWQQRRPEVSWSAWTEAQPGDGAVRLHLVQLHLGYWAPSTGKISVNWSKFRRGTSRCLGILKAGYVQLGEGLRVAQQQFSNALLYRMWAELWLFVSRLNTIFFFVLVCLCLTCPTFICHDACCFACILLNCTSTWLLCYSLKLYCCYCLVCSRFFTKFRIKFLPQTFIMRFINLQF